MSGPLGNLVGPMGRGLRYMKMQPEMGQLSHPVPQFGHPFFLGIGRFSEMGTGGRLWIFRG